MRPRPSACLLLALAVAVGVGAGSGVAHAAPFDGPRWQEFGGQRYAMHEVPGAFSVTFAPGSDKPPG